MVIATPIFLLGSLLGQTNIQQNLGASLPQSVGVFETSLASPITSTATSMTLTANSIRGGGSLSGYNCFTIDEGSTSAEIACGTVSSTSVTSMTRGISYSDGITSVSGNKFSHRRGANIKITDYPVLNIVKQQNNGEQTFPNVLQYASGVTPVTADDIADKGYVDGVAIAGAPDSSTTVKGITKMSVAPASATSPIAVGDNDPRVPTQGENDAQVGNNTDIAVGTGNKFVTQTGLQKNAESYASSATGNDTYVITLSPVPTSLVNGMTIRFKPDTANTGPATLNVNSLGALSIVTGLSTALSTGDILANQVVEVVYNSTGTVWQLVNPASALLSGTTYTSGTGTKDSADASTTQNIAHGLNKIPRNVRLYFTGYGSSNKFCFSSVSYNGTTQSAISARVSNSTILQSSTFVLNTADGVGATGNQAGVVTFDATNIIITWTKNTDGATPSGTYNFVWEAEA